ncbi:MAG: hypothetical protein C4289_10380 [Chloroflexota bacterium]
MLLPVEADDSIKYLTVTGRPEASFSCFRGQPARQTKLREHMGEFRERGSSPESCGNVVVCMDGLKL